MNKKIKTVGDLREMLELCEDNESLTVILEKKSLLLGKSKEYLNICDASSTAGGRAVILWLEKEI